MPIPARSSKWPAAPAFSVTRTGYGIRQTRSAFGVGTDIYRRENIAAMRSEYERHIVPTRKNFLNLDFADGLVLRSSIGDRFSLQRRRRRG